MLVVVCAGVSCGLVSLVDIKIYPKTFGEGAIDLIEEDDSIPSCRSLITTLNNLICVTAEAYFQFFQGKCGVEASWNTDAKQSASAHHQSHQVKISCEMIWMCIISTITVNRFLPNELQSDLDHLVTFLPFASDRGLFCLQECCWTGFWKSCSHWQNETGYKSTWQDKGVRWHSLLSCRLSWQAK